MEVVRCLWTPCPKPFGKYKDCVGSGLELRAVGLGFRFEGLGCNTGAQEMSTILMMSI